MSTQEVLSGSKRAAVVEPRSRGLWSTINTQRTVVSALVAVAVMAGCVLRVVQYFANRSLWLDESQLALNILDRSPSRLTGVLSFNQAAPTAFLLIERFVTDVAGASEYALRLFPLLCGIAAVFFFAEFCRTLLAPPARLLATAVFACASGPIYYASEVKQYSTDVAVTLALYLLTRELVRRDAGVRKTIAASLAGGALIPISHASVFIAAGIFCVLSVRLAVVRGIEGWRPVVATIPWVLSGTALVIAAVHQAIHLANSLLTGSSAGAPGGGSSGVSPHSLRSLLSGLTRSIGYPDAAPARLHWVIVAIACLGLANLVLRRRLDALLLLAPFGALLVASSLHKYPLLDRTVLFLVPATVIFLAEGATAAAELFRASWRTRLLAAGLSSLVLALPLAYASKHLVEPRKHEEIKAALEHIRARWRPTDTLYVDYAAQYAFRYYLECDCFEPLEAMRRASSWRLLPTAGEDQFAPALRSRSRDLSIGTFVNDDYPRLLRQIESLRGRSRVWILYAHPDAVQSTFLESRLVADLNRIGRRLDVFSATGAHTYLYDLKAKKDRKG
jgi:hypothetical protein